MRDEHGRLAPEGRIRALRQLESNLSYWKAQSATALVAPVWIARGPITRGGRARALAIHPERPRILWAATGSGGVWKSENDGSSWRPLTDHLGLPGGSLVIDPRDPDRLYFGSGERFHSGGPGAGVYLSRDGGERWKRLVATRKWRYVPALAISPDDSDLLLAAVADPESTVHSGVYRSVNAGRSWTRVLAGNRISPSALAFQPGNSSRVLLSVRQGLFPNGEVLVSYSDDGGLTWERATGLGTTQFTRYEIAFAPSQPRIAYAASREGVFRSKDGGASFVQRSSASLGFVSWAAMLWVSPTDPDVLLAGGVTLSRSVDGGASWERLDYWDERARDVGHADFQAAVADPGYDGAGNRRVYVLNDGGIDRFDDVLAQPLGARRATSLDRGMQTTEYYAVAGRARDGLLLGGTQDRGVVAGRVGSSRTTLEEGGDGACALIDPTDGRYLYGCSQFLWIVRLQPNGVIALTADLPDSSPGSFNANFIAPVLLDPNAPQRMLAGGASLWRSENVREATHEPGERATWRAIKPPLPGAFPEDDSGLISALAVAAGDSEEIWVAHNDGRLFHTRDGLAGTPSWEAIDDNEARNPLPARWPSRIVVDAFDRRRLFVAFGGFAAGNLWRSDDAGATWRRASGRGRSGLPKAPLWSLAQHPDRPDTLVAGTEVGVYLTENAGRSWAAIPAPFTAAAQDLSFLQGSTTLVVGTFGRGVWTLELGEAREP